MKLDRTSTRLVSGRQRVRVPPPALQGQRSTDGPCAALVRRRLSVRVRPLALGRRTGVQRCLANSASRFKSGVVHSARIAKLEKAPGPEPGIFGVRLPVRVRTSAGCGSAWSEHSVRIRGVARSNRANPTHGAVDEVGRVARLSPGTRCGFEARPRHERTKAHARVAQLDEHRSYTPEIWGFESLRGYARRWWL